MNLKIVISGGGTGGHIFPAIAIADEIKARIPDAEVLFVGAKGKMEMQKVPQAGYSIKGLWISGLQRSLTLKNLLFPIKLLVSLYSAYRIIRHFKPDLAIGVGGFASGPMIYMASICRIPTVIQEQNSYAGITNKWLAAKVNEICVAYDGMEKFFPESKIHLLGNPVRKDLLQNNNQASETSMFKTILIMGGSLGARTLNEAMAHNYRDIKNNHSIRWIWQTGRLYYEEFKSCQTAQLENVEMKMFIENMANAYRQSDLVISRAGALTVSEICVLGKAAILVPSPNVAEDHQTKNALALVKKGAALLVSDGEAIEELISVAIDTVKQPGKISRLEKEVRKLGKPDATKNIVDLILKLR